MSSFLPFLLIQVLAALVLCACGIGSAEKTGNETPVCERHGYTTCPDVCCGRNTTTGQAVCCLEADAICCNRPSLAEKGTRFFCCPQYLPKCDFDAGTCRPSTWQGESKYDDTFRLDFYRAQTKRPRSSYRGRNFKHTSFVLNKHLERSLGVVAVKPCEDFKLEELHELQTLIYKHRQNEFDHVYRKTSDNRQLNGNSLAEFETKWREELDRVHRYPALESVVRDGRCHEAVMWFIHHIPTSKREIVLSQVALPLLPHKRHFERDGETMERLDVPQSVLAGVRSVYFTQIGCGLCHTVPKPSSLGPNVTQCPEKSAARCMVQYRMKCNDSSEFADHHCCPGLECRQWYVPASEANFARNTTRCEPAQKTSKKLEVQKDSHTHHQAATHEEQSTLDNARIPPVLAKAWSADGLYRNITDDNETTMYGTSKMMIYEDGIENATSIRVDFAPVCPFKQLWATGLESNYGPCSVIYRNNTVTYTYPQQKVACTYCEEDAIPPWHRDFLCSSSSTLREEVIERLDGTSIKADLWEIEWWSSVFLYLPNYRNWYFRPGTNVPLRVSEDLEFGYTDFFNYTVHEHGIPDDMFTEPMEGLALYHINGLHGTSPNLSREDARFSGSTGQAATVHLRTVDWPSKNMAAARMAIA